MPTVRFTVPGEPKGQGRPRFSRKSGVAFTPTETRNHAAYVKMLATRAMEAAMMQPFEKPCTLVVRIYCTMPQSWPKKKRDLASSGLLAPGKPDIDNVVKLLADAMNGVVFKDDKQIVHVDARKGWGVVATTEVAVAC